MTKRDWAQLVAWLALAWLVYDDRATEVASLVTGIDNAKRVARLEARVDQQELEIERLKDKNDTQLRIDARQDRAIGDHDHE